MDVIEWNSSYELGIQAIDNHHGKLIELLNKSYDILLLSTDKTEMQSILYELAEYELHDKMSHCLT